MHPVHKFFVLEWLVLRKHIVIQGQHFRSDVLRAAPAHILHRLTHQIPGFEGNNLIGPILNDHVVDLRPYFLHPVQDRLLPSVISVQIMDFRLVLQVRKHGLLQHGNDVPLGDLRSLGIDHPPPE